ncbi:MAG: outer membrane lipoprotein-sorting protein [Planctomycetota bacterium]
MKPHRFIWGAAVLLAGGWISGAEDPPVAPERKDPSPVVGEEGGAPPAPTVETEDSGGASPAIPAENAGPGVPAEAPPAAPAGEAAPEEDVPGEAPPDGPHAAGPLEPAAEEKPAEVLSVADRIVRMADEVRNPVLDYVAVISVKSRRPAPGKEKATESEAQYEVLVKGKEKALVKTLAPKVDRGRTYLVQGADIWVFAPDVSRPIHLALRERLAGEVFCGDIARSNFAGDYTATLIREEAGEGENYYVLELTAKKDEVTYPRVIYRVARGTYQPANAEFYDDKGKLLKRCLFDDYRPLGGRLRPSRLVIEGAGGNPGVSVLEIRSMVIQPLADKLFTKNHIRKLKY